MSLEDLDAQSPEDYDKLDIEMVYTDDMAKDRKTGMTGINVWNCVRTFTSTMINNSNIGRNLHFLIRDRATDSYLGVICITGDFMDLGPRDNFIGWDESTKLTQAN